jgi:hypothetical protein
MSQPTHIAGENTEDRERHGTAVALSPVVNPLTAREHGNPVASNPVVEVELYVAVIVKDPRVAGSLRVGRGWEWQERWEGRRWRWAVRRALLWRVHGGKRWLKHAPTVEQRRG